MSDNLLHDYGQAREEAVEAAGLPADFGARPLAAEGCGQTSLDRETTAA